MSGSANAGTTAERHRCELKILNPEVCALASAPGHVCFSLTEDLHGCRSARRPAKRAGAICSASQSCACGRAGIFHFTGVDNPDGVLPEPYELSSGSKSFCPSVVNREWMFSGVSPPFMILLFEPGKMK